MGTGRTVIGALFQIYGGILILFGIGLLIFGTNVPAFELASLPLSVVTPMGVESLPKFLPQNPDGGCIQGYIVNSDNLCQRIGSDFETPMVGSEIGSLGSLLGFGGLLYLGFGVFWLLIGSVIRGK